ncbi:MAG: bacteriocin transport accessory protein [Lachnospiraceae bacterium]|nr:bacteriocin transport accessory protein [Lachnospiraceae bacterium]
MKKITAILLTMALALSFTACGNKPDTSANNSQSESKTSPQDALTLLNTVWDNYKEDEKFPAAGGDMTDENMTMNAPGKFGTDDSETLDTTFGFPVASADQIDDAASLIHLMNANTFTCGAFHVKNMENISEITTALKDSILHRQWVCGFPDQLVIVTIDDYIVSFFGETEIVDVFKTNLMAAFDSAQIVCDEPIE